MSLHRFKPSPRQELIGRAAMILLAALLEFAGFWILRVSIRMARGIAEAGADESGVNFVFMLTVPALFMMLTGIVLAVMAFLPTTDKRRGPPRGFTAVSRVFDVFWEFVGKLMESH